LFFFGAYQGTVLRQTPADATTKIPTAAMLAGDFTAFASPACNAGRQLTLGAPFSGNKISPTLFSKAALNISAKLPTTSDPCGLIQYGLPTASDEWQQVTKVDYQLNQKHRVFGRYVGTSFFRPPPFSLPEAQQNLLVTSIGGWTIAVIGLFNIFGSIGSGYVSNLMPKRYLLSAIYFSRSLAILIFILLPPSPAATLVFGAAMGILWLSTIPPTSALVVIMFGNRWLTMLLGLAFFSHQVGGFLGVWLGGVLFERTGSYDVVWWGSIFFGVASAIINLPIVEKPVPRRTAMAV
jgi:hypothetical protein